jgi:hypothetical protein
MWTVRDAVVVADASRLIRGVSPVLEVPFHADGSLDDDGFGRVVDHVLGCGVSSVMFPGYASEFLKLTGAERWRLCQLLLLKPVPRPPGTPSSGWGRPSMTDAAAVLHCWRTPAPRSGRGVLAGGRYWDRTSDLFGVNAVRRGGQCRSLVATSAVVLVSADCWGWLPLVVLSFC